MKISSTQKVFDLDTASEFTAGTTHVLVINRDSNDLISVWWNGTKQADQETQAGSLLLDGMGARAAITNYFSGVIYEFVVIEGTGTGENGADNLLSKHLTSIPS